MLPSSVAAADDGPSADDGPAALWGAAGDAVAAESRLLVAIRGGDNPLLVAAGWRAGV